MRNKIKKEKLKKKNGMNTTHCFLATHILHVLLFSFFILLSSFVYSQDFGFGFDDWEDEESVPPPRVSVGFGGKAAVEVPFYFQDFEAPWKDIARADLDFNIFGKHAEAITSYNLSYYSISEFWDKDADWGKSNFTPRFLDEAFLRAYIGPVNIEAGYRKLSWGRADGSGPLDVTNPVDYTDLRNITDMREQKIARPMLHFTWNTGSFSKLEAVFIPNFSGHRFASEGRWAPSQFNSMTDSVESELTKHAMTYIATIPPQYLLDFMKLYTQISNNYQGFSPEFPDTSSIKFLQTGIRFTTTIGPADIGTQYYYGNLFRPSVSFSSDNLDNFMKDIISNNMPPNPANPYTGNMDLLLPKINYSRYHLIGIDYAQILFSLNIRAELAMNITEDLKGTDGSIPNPFIAWSLGFDRDLFWGINLNIQCNETIRLFNGKVGDNPIYDCEAGTNVTSTRLTAQLLKTFLRDNLETKAVVIWDIENSDCYIIPSVAYKLNNFTFNITAGIFTGDKSGELGQYYKNSFIRLGVSYMF